ncbi:YitT family protein [Bulleidia sp. zg-1006]|uniref:YitT family protein n=1 Tax=Bulleidia sp. zg-1006 TaxID=2806552 RepID=UPI00193A29BF|nr:YitT family protein [Bulleidia sp. zg-1006]QRG86236.1 YitT family protein [Bulleidia sp. zg-1006]
MSDMVLIKPKRVSVKNMMMIVLGSAIYAFSVNYFLLPLTLYSGGIPGTSQVLRTLFFAHVTQMDLAGLINLLFNIPLLILAYKTMKKRMVVGTIVSVILQTLVFTYFMMPKKPILDDKLAGIAIAGILGGVGCGLILSNGASAGGLDLVGLYMSSKSKSISVGKFNTLYNVLLYMAMALLFNVQTALYSIIYIVVFSLTIDRWHLQNIEIKLMIFTHNPTVKEKIMKEYGRGVTCWDGKGAYTNQQTEVLVVIVDKSEVNDVKKDIRRLDKEAFVITTSVLDISGGYQKRLL